MGKLDYEDITGNNDFDKDDVQKVVTAVNDNDTRLGSVELTGGRDVTKYTYGANLRGFLKKARDYKAGIYYSKAPTVAILGDSITAGIWAENFRTYLSNTFNIPIENIKIYGYGGYNMIKFMPLIDTELIESNPDLIFFNENEWYNPTGRNTDSYLHQTEMVIQKCRRHTTADIMIGTWSIDGSVAEDYFNGIDIYDNKNYKIFNWFRDMAAIYNCELIDFNQAILNYIDLGNDPAGHSSGVHWDAEWYEAIWNPELVKHFNTNEWQTSINQPYPNQGCEERIFLIDSLTWDKFKDNRVSLMGSGWQYLSGQLKGGTGGILEIEAKNIIGFEMIHGEGNIDAGKQYSIEIDDGTGYKSPSAMRPYGKLMEYATEIISTTYASQENWRAKRVRRMADITASFGDNKTASKRYTLIVTNVVDNPGAKQTVTFDLKDDTGTVLGSTSDIYADVVTAGITLPSQYNGEWNWQISEADDTFPAHSMLNFVVGDEYEFYTKSNWIDTVNVQNDKSAFVFGLEPADYKIKITITVGNVYFIDINLLHSR